MTATTVTDRARYRDPALMLLLHVLLLQPAKHRQPIAWVGCRVGSSSHLAIPRGDAWGLALARMCSRVAIQLGLGLLLALVLVLVLEQ